MSNTNEKIRLLIQSYILTYDELIISMNNGETVITTTGGFSGSGQQSSSTTESDCLTILENSINSTNKLAGGTYYNGTCSLYTDGNLTGGSDTVLINIEIYYSEKLNDILEEIETLMAESDSDLQVKYNELLKLLSTSDNISILERVTAQKNQLIKFAKQNDLLTEQNSDSFDKLRKENIAFRIWVFIFLFVLFLTFQLFTNPILKSISYVCLVFMVTIIISIIRLLNPFLFMIIILFAFLTSVLTLFYKEKYPLSISILIIGSIVFAVVYRL